VPKRLDKGALKILFLTPQLPYPPDKGATIRTFAMIKGLAQRGHHVSLLSLIGSEDDLAWLPQMRPYYTNVDTVLAPPQRSSLTRLRDLVTSTLPDMAWRLPSPEFAATLDNILRQESFDIVQAESMEVAQYALQVVQQRPQGQKRPLVVFDNLNAEYVLQRRAYEIDRRKQRTWPKALYSWLQWRRLRGYERRICTTVDMVLAVSEADAHAITALDDKIEVHVVPNGVDCVFFSPNAEAAEPDVTKIKHMASVIFTGTMSFRPNADAVTWFCQEILPLIKKHVFHVHFYIVGQSPPAAVRALAGPAVTVTGYVSDIRPYIANSSVYVVPMRMGSGTKLKVMEAMAMHIPVVSTTLGAEGIDVTPGRHILLADAPADFASRVVSLLDDSSERQRLADDARRLVEEKYDWTTIVPSLEAIYTHSLLSVA
jgi:sugar transferase (PEP-CTERM/EpsH1 system associated)